jgi:hypothetical protein
MLPPNTFPATFASMGIMILTMVVDDTLGVLAGWAIITYQPVRVANYWNNDFSQKPSRSLHASDLIVDMLSQCGSVRFAQGLTQELVAWYPHLSPSFWFGKH